MIARRFFSRLSQRFPDLKLRRSEAGRMWDCQEPDAAKKRINVKEGRINHSLWIFWEIYGKWRQTMYHPTSRVLTVLELIQSRPSITGPELAARLEMDVRTVRRYIAHLQDVGIPVEANIGRYGGYRLRPGFKLPPLIFTEEEATAITLGLLASSWLEIGQSAQAIEGALAKVSRVLPQAARERLQAVSSHLVLFPHHQQARPDASLLIDLSGAIHASQRILLEYRSYHNADTKRKVEPYGLIGWR